MQHKPTPFSAARVITAVAVGLLGAILIWVVTPYNNYVLANSYVSDSYLPVAALFLLLMLVLVVNPLLRLVNRSWALNFRQLALIAGIWLVASVVPGQGLMRMLPAMLAQAPRSASQNKRLAEAYEESKLPQSLFPARYEWKEVTDDPKPLLIDRLKKLAASESVKEEQRTIAKALAYFLENFAFSDSEIKTLLNELPPVLKAAGIAPITPADLNARHEWVRSAGTLSNLAFGERHEVAEYFATELPAGVPLPWRAWAGPLLTWGVFFLFAWLLMIGLGMIVLPQWRQNERLPFPLLTFHHALIEEPEQGRFFATLFRKKSFWMAAGLILVLHTMAGLKVYHPESVPAIPLNWSLINFFSEEPLLYTPYWMHTSQIYFMFLGFAFFMPSRISFSIVFFQVAYALYIMFGHAYTAKFEWGTISDHKTGALVALSAVILWLGRAHWAKVFAALFRGAATDEDKRNRRAALMFLTGCAGMFGWLVWAQVQWGWALMLVAITFMVSLMVTRFLAETGMPFFRIDAAYPHDILRSMPMQWLGPASVFIAGIISVVVHMASRVSAAAMATHAAGMDPEASPKAQSRVAALLLAVLLLGLFIGGGAHLYVNYNHSMSKDTREQPLNPQGAASIGVAQRDILMWKDKQPEVVQKAGLQTAWDFARGKHQQMSPSEYNRVLHFLFGAGLAGLLYWACLSMPRFPLHPIGLLMVVSYFSNIAWISVFFGALLKVILLRYGGARLFRAATPAFLGVILGEVFALVIWATVPGILALMGEPYKVVPIQPM
jgi:hypothetical protein